MQFYKIEATYERKDVAEEEKDNEDNLGRLDRQRELEWKEEIRSETAELNNKIIEDNQVVFLANRHNDKIIFGVACSDKNQVKGILAKFLEKTEIDIKEENCEEITFDAFDNYLGRADSQGYINDEDEFLDALDLEDLQEAKRRGINYDENMIAVDDVTKDSLKDTAHKKLVDETLGEEIERIYKGGKGAAIGHPIHYMVEVDGRESRKAAYRTLLSALYDCGRIKNRRYLYTDITLDQYFSHTALEAIYKGSEGGTVVIRFDNEKAKDDDEYSDGGRGILMELSEIISKYRHKVLTIICMPRECTNLKSNFKEFLPKLSFVEIYEELVADKRAKNYLKTLCKENGIESDKKLLSKVKEGNSYLAEELRTIYDEWFDRKLKNDCYPQYSMVKSDQEEYVKKAAKGNAYDELMEMIGLESAKKVINDALNYAKAQKVFAEKGMLKDRQCLSFCLTGNAGTCKTTFARLISRVLKDNGILSKGNLIECDRSDIVGKYVGHTAPLVKQKFAAAAGSALFIDEIYSLCENRDGLFGSEAITEIVSQMENHRDDTVVIFAGYPKETEEFLNKNQGLRSRIAYHVHFDDYSTEELLQISDLIAKKKGVELSLGAKQKLRGIYDEARKQMDFGNGRYARNIIEKAKVAQATRLLQMDLDAVTKEDIRTITEQDIEQPITSSKTEDDKRVIGFY